MIKKIILLSAFLSFSFMNAQNNTVSPYSYFGIGNKKPQNINELNQMGGSHAYSDSLRMNISNPATYSKLMRATFSMGASGQLMMTNDQQSKQKDFTGGVDYIAFAVPIKKFAVGLGLMSYSDTGYKLTKITSANNVKLSNNFFGSGGINRAFLGLSYEIIPSLSVGVDASYLFGEQEHQLTKTVADDGNGFAASTGTQYLRNNNYKGLKFTFASHYLKNLENNHQIYAGVTFTPEHNLKNTYKRKIQTVRIVQGIYFPSETKDIENNSVDVLMPLEYAVGVGYGIKNKWFIGADYSASQNSILNKSYQYTEAKFEDTSKITVGGYLTPRYNSFTSYFQRMTYRAGLSYEKVGLVVKGESVTDKALHLGLGFPVGRYASNVNLGFSFGQKGNEKTLKENYMLFSLGFSFNDVWFNKRKFE